MITGDYSRINEMIFLPTITGTNPRYDDPPFRGLLPEVMKPTLFPIQYRECKGVDSRKLKRKAQKLARRKSR